MKRWNKGIGATTQKQRLGFSERDQRDALYECKVAQFDIQEARCGICNDFLDPINTVWCCSRWQNGNSLAQWAFGQELQYNHETRGIDSCFRSPDEIRAEYGDGARGHALFHRRCMGKWKRMCPGMHDSGAAYVRELERAMEEGNDAASANQIARDRLRTQVLATMEEGRTHLKPRKDAWLSDVDERPTPGGGKKTAGYRAKRPKRAQTPGGNTPLVGGWVPQTSDAELAAIQREEDERPETDDERGAREIIELATAAAKGG